MCNVMLRQVENFGMHLNVDGTVLCVGTLPSLPNCHISTRYGMKIEAILDRPADNICLDHLARVLVDVHQVRRDGDERERELCAVRAER
jgi:hypothetical protein